MTTHYQNSIRRTLLVRWLPADLALELFVFWIVVLFLGEGNTRSLTMSETLLQPSILPAIRSWQLGLGSALVFAAAILSLSSRMNEWYSYGIMAIAPSPLRVGPDSFGGGVRSSNEDTPVSVDIPFKSIQRFFPRNNPFDPTPPLVQCDPAGVEVPAFASLIAMGKDAEMKYLNVALSRKNAKRVLDAWELWKRQTR